MIEKKLRILIIDNVFNHSFEIGFKISWRLYNYLQFYKRLKLKRLIAGLLKKYKNNVKIKVITANVNKFYVHKDVQIELLSNYRLNLDRDIYLQIHEKIKQNTKENLAILLSNLEKLKTFQIENISIGESLEFHIIWFLNEIFGEYELIKRILQEKYDKFIFINQNSTFEDLFKFLNQKYQNIEICRDSFLKKINNLPKLIKIKYFFGILLNSFIRINLQNRKISNSKKNNLIFVCNSDNQFSSIKNIYDYYKQKPEFNKFIYQNVETIPLNRLNKLMKFLFMVNNYWMKGLNVISKNMKYDLLKLNNVLKEFYNSNLYFLKFNIFNDLHNFNNFIKNYSPLIVFLADEMKVDSRIYAKHCKNKKIPTIYIPHAAFPIYDEVITRRDFTYLMVPGENDKKYLVETGENSNKIIVTGRPRYEKFNKKAIQRLEYVKDMIDGRLFKFEPDKFTILFTTSPIDYKSRKILLEGVINSIKELNLINNLIIKLHPREDGIWYKQELEALNVNPIIVKYYDILELISSSDLLISRVSTTILEALMIGTPIILLDFINSKFYLSGTYIFTKDKNLISVKFQNKLKDKINELFRNKDFYNNYKEIIKKLANDYIYNDKDRSSLDIIVNLISQILPYI